MERKKDFQPLGWGRREEQGKDYSGEASESQHPPYTEMSLEIAELFSWSWVKCRFWVCTIWTRANMGNQAASISSSWKQGTWGTQHLLHMNNLYHHRKYFIWAHMSRCHISYIHCKSKYFIVASFTIALHWNEPFIEVDSIWLYHQWSFLSAIGLIISPKKIFASYWQTLETYGCVCLGVISEKCTTVCM